MSDPDISSLLDDLSEGDPDRRRLAQNIIGVGVVAMAAEMAGRDVDELSALGARIVARAEGHLSEAEIDQIRTVADAESYLQFDADMIDLGELE